PEREGTEPAIPHPLLDALRAVLSDAALATLTRPLKASPVAKVWPSPRTLHPAPLPLPDTVSVTALSDLLQCPFKFYAEKQLRLASRLRALPRQDLTLGNLGHALMGGTPR
ncbi:MAG: PD-(D/E)XK nuclease family protein, partial [Bilophila sp.]